MASAKTKQVSIGLRAKTGRATAVVLSGPAGSPLFIRRAALSLADPRLRATSQPYHEVMHLPWEDAKDAVRAINSKIEMTATKALSRLIRELESDGFSVGGIGIVGAGNRDLDKIGSTHIRAHAAEGVLFRHVLELAAACNNLGCRAFDERSLEETAAAELKRPLAEIRNHLVEMGRIAGSPWRAEEKSAAVAAWLALTGPRGRFEI